MYYGGGELTQKNNGSKALTSEFVSLALEGKTDGFTTKGGDATKGELETQYDGPRPDPKIAGTCGKTGTYQPMRKQGAIILATGGDNSNSAEGNFYEGFMATGYATDATDVKIQANIIAVGYKTMLSASGRAVVRSNLFQSSYCQWLPLALGSQCHGCVITSVRPVHLQCDAHASPATHPRS